jgi:small-conductance mechanosensitive channel
MPHSLKRLAWLALCVLVSSATANAQEITADQFNPADGISRLERMSQDLAEVSEDREAIMILGLSAQELRRQGQACVAAYRPQMERLKAELDILGEPDPNEEIDIYEQRRAIEDELSRVSSTESNCELLEIRAREFEKRVDAAINRLSAERMWSRGPSLLMELGEAIDALERLPEEVESGRVWTAWESRFEVKPVGMLLVAILLTGLSVAAGLRVRQRFYAWTHEKKLDEGRPTLKFLLTRPPADNAPLLIGGLILGLYAYAAAKEPSLQLLALRIPIGALLFGLGIILIRWSTNKLSPAAAVEGLAPDHIPALRARMRASLLVLVLGFVLLGPRWMGTPPSETLLFPYIILSLALMGCLLSVLFLARTIKGTRRRFRLIRLVATAALLLAAIASLTGHYNFANYLLAAVLTTLLASFFLWLLLWMTASAAEAVARGGSRFSYKTRSWLGLSQKDPQAGLGTYNLIIDLTIWAGFIVIVVNAWDTSDKFPSYVAEIFTDGFVVGTLRVVPINIISGLIAFVAILIATGWVKQAVQKRYIRHSRMDRGARDALLKITGYVGFVVAALVGLKLTGISFAGLAIVAGALSVGIGFGLQNIVNNFVSGLILLFERPIKSGDFVTVGAVEGTVKTISIRSTEIETLDRQNVIVPNSELVSQQVTNWVLHDPVGRLTLDIGVAYGSDVEKVREVLLEVAISSDYVVTDGISAPKPKVLFMTFGDSSLNFELRVWIKQIRRRFDATSDLHFGIDKAFREHDITIPFPQRDLHVKYWPGDQKSVSVSTTGNASGSRQKDDSQADKGDG